MLPINIKRVFRVLCSVFKPHIHFPHMILLKRKYDILENCLSRQCLR